MPPLVSILIPAYNAEPWIAETIQSAVAQTWPRKEIIVVDDGSTDGTLAVARRQASGVVSVHMQANQGAQAARNRALALAQGDYIQWLDADDLLAADKIERQFAALRDTDTRRTLLSGAWGGFFYRVSKAKFTPSRLWADLTPLEWLLRKMESGAHMQTATWLVSRELTMAAGPWDPRLLVDQDGEYFCRVKLASDGIRFVPGSKVYYRRTTTSRVSHIGSSRAKQESVLLSTELMVRAVLSLEDSPATRAACAKYLQKKVIDIYPEHADLAERLKGLAASIGVSLQYPASPQRYMWLQRLIGWRAAWYTRKFVRSIKTESVRSVDRMLFRLEQTRSAHDRHGLSNTVEM